ncbi:MAG: hypothetical protein A2W52_02460 [Candidatus Taylorbacteria bacterium RIFCSPHIGHO2_02_49_25]|uniref:DUF1573 domain-containing protein n=1 Tax=Candidatus Taylorbacteria bacterium RIFCSPHIGHO2_02_49_25 TaxID=1802305 RepID=A0A1G2MD46_9BACT|nr:MAG: hypothetical protein UY62_C0001G0012 [Parcubacteria group bacterium GW2011_GWF2_50_9]OHA19269.1 MAG: hypothetical protein A2759_03170 [Candidatus Taylorbacteria bacterium RIFCSPHIGHO2_01_FULL_49_60]OHA21845.1 MAG: hypothetical protein A2W52_02460 [Candidatus Taylorbacteria bacterium RIFCSPHIGHO2_02_49_25]OHA35571.1 MAG: hypothetical protein A2W65_00740 [Candidatus Taylorbacteria bacterium RIFCSPLOWO2_02_50_13]OHA36860.1 MAG: hypothetical protein A3B27_00995 [Candidatus Taylorbacteria ba
MKKVFKAGIIIVGFFAILFLAGSAISKKTDSTAQNGAAAISAFAAPETFFDFGAIGMKNGKVSRMFSLKNETEQPLTIKRISTSCMCTEAFLIGQDNSKKGPFGMPGHGGSAPDINEVVPPQENRGVDVVFDPAAHGPAGIGKIERAVFVEDGNGGTQVITITALVTP